MATLVLQAAGSMIGGAIGGPIGAMAGRALGGIAGALIDSSWMGGGSDKGARHVEGPRLKEMGGLASTEGEAIPRVYGRARLGGQMIWATRFEEEVVTSVERAGRRGGKGGLGRMGGGSKAAQSTVTVSYRYYANLAVAICEGPVSFIRRVWADGREVDLTTVTMRIYHGTEGQAPDPLITAKEGASPAYRGSAYVVFERLALADYGNRIPQFSFEVVRRVGGGATDLIRAVTLIPGATEFGYDQNPRVQSYGDGVTTQENRHQLHSYNDMYAALDHMQLLLPGVANVSLVTSWFGTDLRAGQCRVEPRVERSLKSVEGVEWQVAGLTRATATPVSLTTSGSPAYGGTPNDLAAIEAIQWLKARGTAVTLYPFIMMDVPVGNGLPDPYGRAEQPPYPWRGRIACHPAPGLAGSPDGTAVAAAEISAFVGTVTPGEVSWDGLQMLCAKPSEWSFRRHILHYARLAEAAGGVDAFVIGSELIGLTRMRGPGGNYPMVDALVAIAADVRAILGPATKITYAADWTEYGAHVRNGGQEVSFPLDPLWASPHIDAVGIDWYPPLTDWRDGALNADAALAGSAADPAYLRNGLVSGEAYEWYYADAAARAAQARLPITDGAYGKPWIYRAKDLPNWWLNPHVERAGGVETAATAWVPGSKPIWLTEVGFPAVDKSANGPNVFPDPKSAESAYPPQSSGARDDLIQMRAIESTLRAFDPARAGFLPAANPVSPVTGLRMVDPARIYVWTWDARPYPAFPDLSGVWADGPNWETGHWITGRAEGSPLDKLIAAILADHGLPPAQFDGADGFVDGYVLDRPMSAREAIEPLARSFGVDAVMGDGTRFIGRAGRIAAEISLDDIVPDKDERPWQLTRAQETELARELRLGFIDGEGEYRQAAVASRRLSGQARREVGLNTAIVTRRAEAQRLADIRLQESWAARETARFSLSPRLIALEPGDVIRLPVGNGGRLMRITGIEDGETRRVEARLVEPAIYRNAAARTARVQKPAPKLPGKPWLVVLNVPAPVGEPPALQALAIFADPWPGGFAISRSDGDGAPFRPIGEGLAPALMGRTVTSFSPGPVWRWDRASTLDIAFSADPPASISQIEALSGGNRIAIQGSDGQWEVFSAMSAELIAPRTVRLRTMLRGLEGTEGAAMRGVAAGAPVIVLDETLIPVASDQSLIGRNVRYRAGPFDRDAADPSVAEASAIVQADALKPRMPVHARARRTAAGISISWIRQTRLGGDAWEPVEVPLAEEREAYRIEIMAGAVPKRSIECATPATLYAAADEIADFGSTQQQLALRIVQLSATAGDGVPLIRTIPIW
jgi:GTA TIM-barrel-like domain/Putative phage tail protein